MKFPSLRWSAAILATCLLPWSSSAEEIAFPDQGNVNDLFWTSKASTRLSFESEGRMAYLLPEGKNTGGTLLALLTQGGGDAFSPAEKFSIDLRTSSHNSFGIYLKGADRTSPSYLFLLQARPEQRGVIRLCKLPLLPLSGKIDDHELKATAFKNYDSSTWHRLELTLKEVGGAMVLEALLLHEDGREIAHLVARDAEGPLTGPGLVGLRFYTPPSEASDGFEDEPYVFDVRRLNISPAPAQ